jgi:putative endonuclease
MTYFTYILRCADDTLYTGITTDLERRVWEHASDDAKWAKYTRVRRPVELVYHEKHASRSEACKREYAIKQMKREEKLRLLDKAD